VDRKEISTADDKSSNGKGTTVFPGPEKTSSKNFNTYVNSLCPNHNKCGGADSDHVHTAVCLQLTSLGTRLGKTASHSWRKGAATFASSGRVEGPPITSTFYVHITYIVYVLTNVFIGGTQHTHASCPPPHILSPGICLRADWSMGDVLSRYFKYGGAGDQYLGRILCGLNIEKTFDVLPPHFKETTDVDELDAIEQGLKMTYGATPRSALNIDNGEDLRPVLLRLLAVLVYQHEWFQKNLNDPDHKILEQVCDWCRSVFVTVYMNPIHLSLTLSLPPRSLALPSPPPRSPSTTTSPY